MKLMLLIFLFAGCASNTDLVKEDDVYLYQGKEQIIISFKDLNPNDEVLNLTGSIISFIYKNLPDNLKEQNYYAEGLTGDSLTDFMILGDMFFFSTDQYKNKTFIYAYLTFLHHEFSKKHLKTAFIPIREFNELFQTNDIKDTDIFIKYAVRYAIDDIYFVSILELLERQDRYFYPLNSETELYRALIYPEILTFWHYIENRFGKDMLLTFAEKSYTPEDFSVTFGEKTSDIENAYVKTVENITPELFTKNQEFHIQFTNILKLYLAGTKRSLMSE